MKKLLLILFPFLLLHISIIAQDSKIGRHTIAEWRHIIDTTWGEGQTTAQKLQIFDNFWNAIDKRYAGFEGIVDNWQQLKSWRDTIAQGVSRGRFAGIFTQLVQSLHDGHVYMCDEKIASTPMLKDIPLLVPAAINYPSFNWNATDHFGAALTPLADSTLLVYNAVDNHPLGLVPGDIVLGYDGRPWKELYKELLQVRFPVSFPLAMACSEQAATHQWLGTAGLNWHLFDTIDIVKYATGDTVHLSTSLITDPLPGIHATEQKPVSGVSFPDVAGGHLVSYGYVEGTKIGYMYVWGWSFPSVNTDFLNAVNAFIQDSSSDGLIIDLRTNEGADNPRWNEGFRRLFNQDINVIKFIERASSTNHLIMQSTDQWNNWIKFSGSDQQLYDRPIAVLCGPWTASGGDMSVQMLRQHPMSRTFGKPTEGAFGVTIFNDIAGISSTDWFTGLTVAVGYTPPDKNNVLNRASIPVDEEVWLTPDGVAKGEDDVVKAALNWIDNLVYGHSFTMNTDSCSPGDTLIISALVENPNSHQTSAMVYIKNLSGSFIDSLSLTKTGLVNSSEIWSCNYLAPAIEDSFNISLSARDISDSKIWTIPNISSFKTIDITIGINGNKFIPTEYSLFQNYPNPFNPTTNIQYSIVSRQFVELKIFNVLGQEIETLVNDEISAGNYQVEFKAANLPSGVYFYRIQAGSFVETKKMILMK